MKRISYLLALLLTGAVLFGSCVRKHYDAPPDMSGYDPHLAVTHTIAQLKALNGTYNATTGEDTTLVTGDIVIAGVVTADDRSGNLYKRINIEDSTGGIQVLIDAYSLYNDYPVGRKIYIKCKGLMLGYDGGTIVLGESSDEKNAINGITGSAIEDHIVKADIGHTVTPVTVTLAQLSGTTTYAAFINRLVKIDSVQFVDTTLNFTQPNGTTNRDLADCSGAKITVRTSNYANFAAQRLPSGKGPLTAVFTVFISSSGSRSPQLLVRDYNDVQGMTNARCGGGTTPVVGPIITIDSLRKLYPGTGTVTLPAVRFTGVVISDIDKGNAPSGNFIIEDASRKGVTLYISGSSAYKLGDSLVLDVSAGKLQLYNGGIELTGVTTSKITKAASGKSVTPTTLTLAQLNASFFTYESTLVKILNATVTGGGTYSGNKTLTDGTGSISLYTAPTATFAGVAVPATAKTFVGIATPFTPNEIKLRDPAIDVL